MYSKQERLKYAEQLRRQIKQKEDKKKQENMQKRGMRKSPTDPRIPFQPQPYIDNKQVLQNKFQSQNNDYFGRPGGGAPNRQIAQQNYQNIPQQHNAYEQNQIGRQKTQQQYSGYQNEQNQGYNNNYPPQRQQPQFQNIPRGNIDPQMYANGGMQNYPGYQRQNAYNQPTQQMYGSPYSPPSYPQNLNNMQPGLVARVPTDRSFVEQQQFYPQGYPMQQQPIQVPQQEVYRDPIQEINQRHEALRQRTMQNQQKIQIHKKAGGRNLLQFENITLQQQIVKQKQKQQMRKVLQNQVNEAKQRKKMEEQRIKRQQLQEEQKNKEYLEMQKRRFQQQQRKKAEKQRAVIQQNVKNLQQRRRLQEQAKQKAMKQKMKKSIPNVASQPNSPKMKEKQVFSRQVQNHLPGDETTSEVSSSTVMQKGFNTGVSKQFFENQRRKDQERYNRERNLQAVTNQIKTLKQQIQKQTFTFKKQIQKIKLESQMAQHQKLKAEQQIQSLKAQLKKKMQDDNQRLFLALQRQEKLQKQQTDYYETSKRANQRRAPPQQYYENGKSLKPSKDEILVKKQYQIPQSPKKHNQNLGDSNVSDNGLLMSLHGESKKIPINLPDNKLSMSQLSDFARQTQFFKNDGKSPYLGQNQKKASLKVHESIVQEDEDRAESRAAGRKQPSNSFKQQKDELDKLVETRQKSRNGQNWGEMSSVNSDITKQIEQLLRKKQNPYRPPSSTKYDNQYSNGYSNANERPSSHLSNAGKRALSRNGLDYDGASLGTLNSNVGGINTIGTLDIDRIHNKNEKRLNQLRNLGVETINTNNGDEQFSKLDLILNNYKQQSRVL